MAQVELTRSYVTYQAQTKLLELSTEIAEARNVNKPEIKEKLVLATKIRLWLKALQYYTYLEKPAIDKLVYCLADLCDANALPYSPQITTVEQPDLIIGGSRTTTNITSSDITDWSNLDVDSAAAEVLDSFAVTAARGAVWYYTVRKGSNQRSGVVVGSWLADGSSVVYSEDSTEDIGDTTGVTLAVDFSTTIRLKATVTSDDWVIEGSRLLING